MPQNTTTIEHVRQLQGRLIMGEMALRELISVYAEANQVFTDLETKELIEILVSSFSKLSDKTKLQIQNCDRIIKQETEAPTVATLDQILVYIFFNKK